MKKTYCAVLLFITVLAGQNVAGAAPSPETRCSALLTVQLDGVKIHSATLQAAGQKVPGSSMPPLGEGLPPIPDVSGLPEFCRVNASAHPEPG